jgi:hypothetical protein
MLVALAARQLIEQTPSSTLALQITMPQRDTDWSTWTSRLGFPVMGVFPPGFDGTEINAVDRSKDKSVCDTR